MMPTHLAWWIIIISFLIFVTALTVSKDFRDFIVIDILEVVFDFFIDFFIEAILPLMGVLVVVGFIGLLGWAIVSVIWAAF